MHPDRDLLRRRYWPARVRLLFIGESPPASGRFFYAADSGLYRAVREAFVEAFPALEEGPSFLEAFRDASCALIDLCDHPVDRMAMAARRSACRAGEYRLAAEIAGLRPLAIVTVVRSIENSVLRARDRAGWSGIDLALPYPGRWIMAKRRFVEMLAPALREWSGAGVLPAGMTGSPRSLPASASR